MQYLLTVLGNRRGYGRDGVSYVELTLAHARTLPSAQCMLYLLTSSGNHRGERGLVRRSRYLLC